VWECLFSLLSFPSRSFFLSLCLTLLPPSPPFFGHSFLPSTMVLPTTLCQTKYIIFIIYYFSILSLNLFFYWRYFLSFQTATFIVRSWLPWNVFRKISTIKVLSFIFPTKPTKKNHVWITLLRRPLHRRTSLHAGNICSMFEQPKLKSETYDSLILI